MDVFCVGMYRAGSTWQYDVASQLLERHRAAQRLGFVTGDHYSPPSDPAPAWRILKAHDAHPAFSDMLQRRQALALYCYRDLRDVCFSLMHKFGASFAEVVERRRLLHLCLDNDAFWRAQPGVLCQRYEALTTDPAAAAAEIAAQLGVALAAGEATAVAEEYSLTANQWRAIELANRLREQGVDLADPANANRWDARTLLHWNHIRSGRVGDWRRQATRRQLTRLAEICGPWLIANGYARDGQWAQPGWRDRLKRLLG